MNGVTLRACAKINLYLQVTGKREDGYHTLQSVMQTVGTYDDVTVEKSARSGVSLKVLGADLPNDERNIAFCAAKAYAEATGISGGFHVTLNKRIPYGTGLGGGSADAAAVLRGCQLLSGGLLSTEELVKLARGLGSDVPFGLFGGACAVGATGDDVTPLRSMPSCCILLAFPAASVSTAQAYKQLDEVYGSDFSKTSNGRFEQMCLAMNGGDYAGIVSCLENCFLPVVSETVPEVSLMQQRILAYDCDAAGMSGSGPAVYGVYASRRWDKAERAKANVLAWGRSAVLTEPVDASYALYYRES